MKVLAGKAKSKRAGKSAVGIETHRRDARCHYPHTSRARKATAPVRYFGIDRHIGNTPLVRLRATPGADSLRNSGQGRIHESRRLGQGPGRPQHHRAGAEAAGKLKPGETIIEGTAGNTGIGLAVARLGAGLPLRHRHPRNSVDRKKSSCSRTLGAKVFTVPEKPYSDPGNYNHQARRLAEENGWFWANQFDNTDNRLAHYRTTGPEIWEQTSGEVTAFVSSVGTGRNAGRHDDVFEGAKSGNRLRLPRSIRRGDVVVVRARESGNQRRRFLRGRHRANARH